MRDEVTTMSIQLLPEWEIRKGFHLVLSGLRKEIAFVGWVGRDVGTPMRRRQATGEVSQRKGQPDKESVDLELALQGSRLRLCHHLLSGQ